MKILMSVTPPSNLEPGNFCTIPLQSTISTGSSSSSIPAMERVKKGIVIGWLRGASSWQGSCPGFLRASSAIAKGLTAIGFKPNPTQLNQLWGELDEKKSELQHSTPVRRKLISKAGKQIIEMGTVL